MAKKKRKAKKNPKRRAAKKRSAPKRSNPRRAKKRSAPKRSNPRRHHASKRKNPRRRHARKRNPGFPEIAGNVGKVLLGGAAAAGVVAGVMAAGRRFPMTKGKAIGLQLAGAAIGGGTLAALGAPAAGVAVAASLVGTSIATAQTPSVPTPTDNTRQVSGVLPHVAGLLGESVDRQRMVSGILKGVRAGR